MSGLQNFLAGLAAFSMSGSALAIEDHGLDSQYTRIDEGCTTRQLPDEPVYETVCPGQGGWTLDILSGEHGAAVALPDANRIARDVTDRLSRGWDCDNEVIRLDANMASGDAYLATVRIK